MSRALRYALGPKSAEKMPTFSSNDRSRWATVRSLVENGTFVVGKRVDDPLSPNGYRDEGIAFQDGYKSVDLVKNLATNEFYSTKPPLFTLSAAGEYWLLNKTLGWSLANAHDRWPVVCTILLTFNLLPLLIFLRLLANLLEEYGTTDWGRLFVYTAACFGTFMTTFAVSLNNHTPAACCVMFAIYPLLRRRSGESIASYRLCDLLTSGFFAGLAACFDLPAAILTAGLALLIFLNRHRRALWFSAAALVPIAALIAINYTTFDTVVPIYAKKDSEWYKYPGSHWLKLDLQPPPPGIDFAHEPKEVYSFHMLLGHHGLFSLTPIWLLTLFSVIRRSPSVVMRRLYMLALLCTMVVVAFYIAKTNNYEGWTSGPRWAFWLTPLLLLAMIPAADRLSSTRGGRSLGYLLLGVSVFSATYPVWNPWRHPWPYQLCEYMDWLKY